MTMDLLMRQQLIEMQSGFAIYLFVSIVGFPLVYLFARWNNKDAEERKD